MKKRIGIELALLALVASVASADTFSLPFIGAGPITHHYSMQVDQFSTHTVEIVGCPSGYVDWYITEFGGSPVETDTVSFLGVPPPSFTRTFSTPGTAWVRAEIYGDSGYLETHLCEVTVGYPDLRSSINLSSGTYQPGDTVSGTVNVSNTGDASSASGYVDLFLNRGSPSYDPSDRVGHEFYTPISSGSGDNSPFSFTIPPDTPPGTYYLTSLADATDTSDEGSGEGNNTDQKTIAVVQPDLIVEDIWTEPSQVIEGANYVIRARIRNQGNAMASGGQVAWFFVDGAPVGNDGYGDVAPGASVVVETDTFALTGPPAGSHSVRVEADYYDDVAESNESNNDRTESFLVDPPPLPDLIISGFSAPSTVIAGEMFSIGVTVANTGTAGAGSSHTGIFVDGSLEETIPTPPLASGSQQTVICSVMIPTAGSYPLRARADVYDEVAESNEDNNWSPSYPIIVLPPPMPDLIVEDITVDPGYAWRPNTITAVIRNIGDAPAEFGTPAHVCQIKVDGQPITGGDVVIQVIVTIPAGGAYPVEVPYTPSNLGSSLITAIADPGNGVPESNETNNSRTESMPWIASPVHDTDGDGMVDADEVIAGSDPTNISNVWECAVGSTNAGFMVVWPSIPDRWYAVERTCNLTNDFVVIASNLPATPPENSYLDSTVSNAFYRIEVSEEQW